MEISLIWSNVEAIEHKLHQKVNTILQLVKVYPQNMGVRQVKNSCCGQCYLAESNFLEKSTASK